MNAISMIDTAFAGFYAVSMGLLVLGFLFLSVLSMVSRNRRSSLTQAAMIMLSGCDMPPIGQAFAALIQVVLSIGLWYIGMQKTALLMVAVIPVFAAMQLVGPKLFNRGLRRGLYCH